MKNLILKIGNEKNKLKYELSNLKENNNLTNNSTFSKLINKKNLKEKIKKLM
ncbi:hypothetical protein NUSPORA_02241 [Nucleospora cyclopteri]